MMKTKSRSTGRNVVSRGCTTIIPIMPIAIWTISSECGWYRKLVGDEDADLVAFDGLDRRSRSLPVVAPQICLHAFGKFAYDRFSDEMKLLPVAVHPPG